MSAFDNSFVMLGDDAVDSVLVSGSFNGESIYTSFTDSVTVETMADDVFESQPSVYGEHTNGFGIDGSINGVADGPILPPPSPMEPEEGFAVREWRRQNAILLEEKEKREKELRIQVIEEAEHYKAEFHKKREITTENNKIINREKEKLFLTREEKFNAEADKDYWKAIAELIPKEVSTVEKRHRKKDDDEKQPLIAVVRGPKPGRPTDLTRMRQILLKLKQNPPPHLKTLSSSPSEAVARENVAVAATSEAVVAA